MTPRGRASEACRPPYNAVRGGGILRAMGRNQLGVVVLALLSACGGQGSGPGSNPGADAAAGSDAGSDAAVVSSDCNSWRQWGNNAAHAGASCVRGQPLGAQLSSVVYDPFLDQEVADAFGLLVVHYQTPLIDGGDLYMMTKNGVYTACKRDSNDSPSCIDTSDLDALYRRNSQIWSEQRFTIAPSGKLALQWSYDSDWKPEPDLNFFEPVFQPALAGPLLVVPGAGGALWELDRISGQVVRHVMPFGADIDVDTYVSGALAVGGDGTIYYNALKLDRNAPSTMPAQAWLVAVSPDGVPRTADYASLVPAAPAADAPCSLTYNDIHPPPPQPWPPLNLDGSVVLPPTSACGSQTPGLNAAPAIGADGTIFTVSHAQFNPRYSYVIAAAPDLSPKWATSLRDTLHDGCGVTTPIDGTDAVNSFDCQIGAPPGVERETGFPPAGQVADESSSSPVALPDGGVLYGAITGYNSSRGHLFKLDPGGAIKATFDFGWDSTPAVFGDAANYKIVIKDNHYGADAGGVAHGPFLISELDSSLNIVWSFQSTNTKTCAHQADGSVACTDDHPNGFEWCINAPAVDRDGTVYANSEDGNTYAITPDGKLRDKVFLDRAIGAAYTPIALDQAGHVFALNAGRLAVLGQ
jgi:outer membrane protein assembly factor BamB